MAPKNVLRWKLSENTSASEFEGKIWENYIAEIFRMPKSIIKQTAHNFWTHGYPQATLHRRSKKKVFWKIQQIYRRATVSKFDFNKVAWQIIIEIILQHGCSLVNLPHISRTPFPDNTSGGQLLDV